MILTIREHTPHDSDTATLDMEHDAGGGESFKKVIETYGPYLTNLWQRLYKTAILFCVVFVIGFFCAQPILAHFLAIFHVQHAVIIAPTPFQFIDLSVDVGFFFAFLITIPYFMWQICTFVRPAVSIREFLAMMLILVLSFLLFGTGFIYGVAALYTGLQAMADLNISVGLQNYWDVGAYITTIITTAILLGILFQFPLIITLLARVGFIDHAFLVRHRRIVYALIVVFVALLPPTDGLSLIIMSVPLIVLYEITVWLNRSKVLITQ